MDPPGRRLWCRIPGYDSDSDGSSDGEVGKDDARVESAKERLQDVMTALGEADWKEPRPVVFYPAPAPGVVAAPSQPTKRNRERPWETREAPPKFKERAVAAPMIRDTFSSNGLSETHINDWCIFWSGAGTKEGIFTDMHEYQRVNHFPSSWELTRKDTMFNHLNSMAKVIGEESYDFVPETFVLPDQSKEFLDYYMQEGGLWIVKPANAACGRGIYILRDVADLPNGPSVVSRYVHNPLLIQGLKFDLRVYVLVTQYEPLRAYIYREGLARFASAPYDTEEQHLQDAYRHLTNYSINKFAPNFMENQELQADNYGHKWSLSALNKHLKCIGVDERLMWCRIMDLIVKSLLAVEPTIAAQTRKATSHSGICFEIYGFDVLVDEDLNPWILEVNLSPSMSADSPLDWQVKSSLLADAFNLIGVCQAEGRAINASRVRGHVARLRAAQQALVRSRAGNTISGLGPGLKSSTGSRKEKIAELSTSKDEGFILNNLSDLQLRILARSLQETGRCHNFIPLYPTRRAVQQYRPITDMRAKRSAPSNSKLSHQLLASLLFGPRPRLDATKVKASIPIAVRGGVSLASMFPAAGLMPPKVTPHALANAASRRPLRSFSSPMLETSAVEQLHNAGSLNGHRRPGSRQSQQDSEDAIPHLDGFDGGASNNANFAPSEMQEEQESTTVSNSEEYQAQVSMASSAISVLPREDGCRLLFMSYLENLDGACDSLTPESRAHLAQSPAFSRLSRFCTRLKAALPKRSANDAPGCLVEEVGDTCKRCLAWLGQGPWKFDFSNSLPTDSGSDASSGNIEKPPSNASSRKLLLDNLPADMSKSLEGRKALEVLPLLRATDMERLLRTFVQDSAANGSAMHGLIRELFWTASANSPLSEIMGVRAHAVRHRPAQRKASGAVAEVGDWGRSAMPDMVGVTRRPRSQSATADMIGAAQRPGSLGRHFRQDAGSKQTSAVWSDIGTAQAQALLAPLPQLARQHDLSLLPAMRGPQLPDRTLPRQKASQLLIGNGHQVTFSSSVARPHFGPRAFEADSIEL